MAHSDSTDRQTAREIEQLRRENRRLIIQITDLVQAEAALNQSQAVLDQQIRFAHQLNEVSRQFNTTFSQTEILDLIGQFVISDLNFECCLMLAHQIEGQSFQPCRWFGYYGDWGEQYLQPLQLPVDDPMIQLILSGAESVICAADNPDLLLTHWGEQVGLSEWVMVPMGGSIAQPMFMLIVGNTLAQASYFTRIQGDSYLIAGLITLISHASAVLNQTQLYTQARTRAEELQQALNELKRTQAQLVQSEKMSSLGQLVAGVAHEINNPVSFIFGNLEYAQSYTDDLLRLMTLYQQHYPEPVEAIGTMVEAIELEFLMQDLPKLLTSMKVGADRIQTIVRSLRTFSRMDEADFKTVDIHEGIDSTLMILQHRLKQQPHRGAIAVIKDYGDLPPINCYAGQLNQVFMNILANAIDALEDVLDKRRIENPPEGTIKIQTQAVGDRVLIRMTDNGPGIAECARQRLFDPFFTTKPIGKGTGMGLSISYQIITEQHGGSLECLSQPGHGAEFVIEIPVISISQ